MIRFSDRKTADYYKDIFLKNLCDILNKEKQESAWIKDNYSDFNIFSELYMQFMDPCEEVLKWKCLSGDQRQKLQKLYDMLENYDEFHPDNTRKTEKEICNDPKWHKIREFARIVYDDLKDVKYVPDNKK